MRRSSDWLLFPPELGYPHGAAGGIWVHQRQRYVHRSLLPALPEAMRAGVGAPLRSSVIPDVDVINLRPYQAASAAFARERDGSILAMSMGTGKTRTSLYATKLDGDRRGLIVAPKVTFSVWQKEIALVYGPDYPLYTLRGQTPADGEDMSRPGIYLINPEILPYRWKGWLGHRFDFAIFDEAHLFTRGRAQRTKAVAALANLSRQRVALTGTPILRHVMDLHGIIEAVAPGSFGSWPYMALWLGFHRGAHGWDLGPISPAARDRLEARLTEVMVTQRWEDVSSDVPPLQREMLTLDLDPAERAKYDRLASDVREVFQADEATFEQLASSAASGLMQVSALRRYVGQKKIAHAVDLVRSTGEPVVVWTWHREAAREIAKRLHDAGLAVSLVTGEDKDAVRQERILQFQNAGTDVFVGTIAVGGVGIDLTRARITVMAELSWLPTEIAQAEARVFRSGQSRPCITYWPIFRDTIEHRIIEVLIAKADHARTDIFPGMAVQAVAYDPAKEMISLLEHALEEDEE